MKRLHPPTFKSRDGSGTILQLHEDEAGKAPQAGGPPGVVAPGLLYVAANHCIAVDPGQRIGVILAAKVAVMELLIGLVMYDVELKALLLRRQQAAPRIEVRSKAISIDWPEAGVDAEAAPKFTVRGADDFKFDGLGLSGPDYDADSADKFGEGTVLKHQHDVTGTVIIETTLNTPSARDSLQAALADRFGTEPHDLRTGRRIALKCYYDQIVRITFAQMPFSYEVDPTGEKPKANEYPLACFLEVDLPDVMLVQSPGFWRTIPRPKMP